MKRYIVLIGFILIAGLAILFNSAPSNSSQDYQFPHHLFERANYVKPQVQLPYEDGRALVYAGQIISHLQVNGSSCMGSCHDVTKGGHPVIGNPSGGGRIRTLEKTHNETFGIVPVLWKDDRPDDDPPAFHDTADDPCILWDCVTPRNDSMSINEEQGFRGIEGHDLKGLDEATERNVFALYWLKKAFGNETVTENVVVCAIAAYMQQINTGQSNVAKGEFSSLKSRRGGELFMTHCYDCHENPDSLRLRESPNPLESRLTKPPKLGMFFTSPVDYRLQREVPLGLTDEQRYRNIIEEHEEVFNFELGRWDAYYVYLFNKLDMPDNNMDRYLGDFLNLKKEENEN
jgi:hypothetical protein